MLDPAIRSELLLEALNILAEDELPRPGDLFKGLLQLGHEGFVLSVDIQKRNCHKRFLSLPCGQSLSIVPHAPDAKADRPGPRMGRT
ncbi:MAG: hypothetical protein Kow00105_18300 [Phycisphaeraceae bacterium]